MPFLSHVLSSFLSILLSCRLRLLPLFFPLLKREGTERIRADIEGERSERGKMAWLITAVGTWWPDQARPLREKRKERKKEEEMVFFSVLPRRRCDQICTLGTKRTRGDRKGENKSHSSFSSEKSACLIYSKNNRTSTVHAVSALSDKRVKLLRLQIVIVWKEKSGQTRGKRLEISWQALSIHCCAEVDLWVKKSADIILLVVPSRSRVVCVQTSAYSWPGKKNQKTKKTAVEEKWKQI